MTCLRLCLVIFGLFVNNWAVAQAPNLLTGNGAQGGWHLDRPGQLRWIRAEDITKMTPSNEIAALSAEIVARPAGKTPRLPKGFKAELFAEHLDQPRTVKVAPNGDIFVAESGAGRIQLFQIDENGREQSRKVFAAGLKRPFGIAFFPPDKPVYVYIAEEHQIVRYAYDGSTQPAGAKEVVVADLPRGGHWTRDLAVAPEGDRLFYSIGSYSNLAEGVSAFSPRHGTGALGGNEEGRAMVFSFDPDGNDIRPYATGLRNCAGLTIQPETQHLWCVVNERDGLGDNLPPEYATRVEEGAFYGWPWFYIGQNRDPHYRNSAPDLAGQVRLPDILIEAHAAPLGIVFYDGNHFPTSYKGSAFVALHGSWNRSVLSGYKIVRLLFNEGKPTGQYEDFMTGFVLDDEKVWGRPVSLAVAQDGALLISEDGNGTIWRITYAK